MFRFFLTRVVSVALLSAGVTGCLPSESSSVRNVHTVVPGVLIRGGQPDERGLRELKRTYGVTTVVNFNHWTNKSETKDAAKVGLNYLPLNDDPFTDDDNDELILLFLKAVHDRARNGTVYVHCKTGQDRTGFAVGAYRIIECGWDAERAIAEQHRYQNAIHGVFFRTIPSYLRNVERHRADWLRRLSEMPDPPVQRPELK